MVSLKRRRNSFNQQSSNPEAFNNLDAYDTDRGQRILPHVHASPPGACNTPINTASHQNAPTPRITGQCPTCMNFFCLYAVVSRAAALFAQHTNHPCRHQVGFTRGILPICTCLMSQHANNGETSVSSTRVPEILLNICASTSLSEVWFVREFCFP
jgi:hypothetical protein